jgi:hypothetical protein
MEDIEQKNPTLTQSTSTILPSEDDGDEVLPFDFSDLSDADSDDPADLPGLASYRQIRRRVRSVQRSAERRAERRAVLDRSRLEASHPDGTRQLSSYPS